MTDNALKIIKDELARIDEARAKATQGEWKLYKEHYDETFPTTVAFTQMASYEESTKLSIIMARLGVPDKICMEQKDINFIFLAANEITNLTKALSVAVEALEDVNHGFSKSGLRYGGMQYEQISAKAITTIANILSGGKDGK